MSAAMIAMSDARHKLASKCANHACVLQPWTRPNVHTAQARKEIAHKTFECGPSNYMPCGT